MNQQHPTGDVETAAPGTTSGTVDEATWQHISQARWFSGKGRGGRATGRHLLDPIVDRAGLVVRPEVIEVGYPNGAIEYYQLLVSVRPEPLAEALLGPDDQQVDGVANGHRHDTFADPEALQAVIAAFADGRQTQSWSVTNTRPLPTEGPVRVFGGEQSNTSVLVGNQVLVKFFRRLEIGQNLDIAVHDALMRAGVTSVARLYGWVSADLPDALAGQTPTGSARELAQAPKGWDLAMMIELLPGARDGWDLAVAAAERGDSFTESAAALGTALAQIHLALADTFGTDQVTGAELATITSERLDQAIAEAPEQLEPLAEGLRTVLRRCNQVPTITTQRIHGDFHLGQTLDTDLGWRIIDFEGEPLKTLAQRSEPDSVWRDVAGMLRSFDYASASCPTDAPAWAQSTGRAFLDAYQQTSGLHDEHGLLGVYEADKAIYELLYEIRNRPDWVHLPLGALQRLAQSDSPDPDDSPAGSTDVNS